ncbi:hypothetical protein CS369_22170 (plasmid) [Candidatus Symbiopectobacterium sp. 'North America']|uniref:hypothetical protein n=1 Tax=Candidatus Symbiopectobacterium sp. 'North America' TaxID=2794574 RepID=UPI0018C9DF7A|nr:hypothetical protein [Candidatus Symbiopectobacterium sp. 'North America']MBG6246738.1 hypothetical protein [Candidatus Symbiopectobacterium sp. 'North America']
MANHNANTTAITVRFNAVEQLHVGSDSQVRAGDGVTITALDRSGIKVGHECTVICREHCRIIAKDLASIDAGCYTDVRAGEDSNIIVGENSVVAAGIGSSISFRVWIGDCEELISVIVDEKKIRADATYSFRNGHVTCIQ